MPQSAVSPVIQKKKNEQSRRWSKQRNSIEGYDVLLLWREDKVKLQINFYTAMKQQRYASRKTKFYQNTTDMDADARYFRKVDQSELNETRQKLQ